MKAADLVAALNTVEEDHELVMEKVRALKEAVILLFEPGNTDLRRVLGRLQALDRYFASHFASHLEEEEITLFPVLEAQLPEGKELVARLRQEHSQLMQIREEFSNCIKVAVDLDEDLPRAVIRDLLGYGWELWEELDLHAHLETQAVHKCIAKAIET